MNEPKQKCRQKYRLWHIHYFAHISKYNASENELLHNRRKNCRAYQLNYKSACIKALIRPGISFWEPDKRWHGDDIIERKWNEKCNHNHPEHIYKKSPVYPWFFNKHLLCRLIACKIHKWYCNCCRYYLRYHVCRSCVSDKRKNKVHCAQKNNVVKHNRDNYLPHYHS